MRRLFVGFAVSVAGMSGPGAMGQVIRLNAKAAAEVRQNIRLGDIATVKGTDTSTAETLENLVILPELGGSRSIRAEAVLLAVITQVGPGSLADHLQIAGSATCDIEVGKPETSSVKGSPSATLQAQSPANPGATPGQAANQAAAPDARGKPAAAPLLSQLITSELEQELAAGPDDIRVSFDTMSPLLDQAPPGNRKWVLRPLMRVPLGSVQIDAELVEGVRVVQKLSIQVQVLKRETVLVAATPIARGSVVTQSNFKSEDSWMDRAMPTLLREQKNVIGLEALRDVAVGSNLDSRDFKPVSMAERGDTVTVIFIHGNLKVQMKGRAVGEGKLHDTIQVKNEVTNEVYDAVLIGKRLAVVGGTLDEAQEAKLREAP
jgi:flagella basal body P-ring formation protein FlgA